MDDPPSQIAVGITRKTGVIIIGFRRRVDKSHMEDKALWATTTSKGGGYSTLPDGGEESWQYAEWKRVGYHRRLTDKGGKLFGEVKSARWRGLSAASRLQVPDKLLKGPYTTERMNFLEAVKDAGAYLAS